VEFFPFLVGSSPDVDPKYAEFVMRVCGYQNGGFLWTLCSWHYFTWSLRQMLQHHYLQLFPGTIAAPGQQAPDAEIVTLTGQAKSLLKDYIQALPADVPMVLNFGSYT